MQTNYNKNSPGRSSIPVVSKTWRLSILTFINVLKLIAEPGYLSAIFTIRQNKHNLFRNFSQSILFPGTKLASEFTWILKILNIIKSFWGKLYYGHGRWAHLRKIWMNVKIGHFQAPLFRSEKLWIDLLSFKGILYNLVCKLTLICKVFVTRV